jgi:hypothetical protein
MTIDFSCDIILVIVDGDLPSFAWDMRDLVGFKNLQKMLKPDKKFLVV